MTCFEPEFLYSLAESYHWHDLKKQLSSKSYSHFNPLELEDIWDEIVRRYLLIIGDPPPESRGNHVTFDLKTGKII